MQDKQNRTLYIVLAVAALVLIGLFAYLFRNNDATKWGENYAQDNTDPYGLQVFRKLMNTYFAADSLQIIKTTLTKDLPPAPPKPTNYVFVGNAPFYDSTDVVRLTTFVRNGNTALLVAKSLPPQLCDSLLHPYACHENAAQYDDMYEQDTTDIAHIDIDSLIAAREAPGYTESDTSTPANASARVSSVWVRMVILAAGRLLGLSTVRPVSS